jgi:Trk K+ transport system NAD-binding subunit
MKQTCAAVFGYNAYSKEVIKNIKGNYHNIGVFVLTDDELLLAQHDGLMAEKFDLSDDWKMIEERFDVEALVVFCTLMDDAHNVFLIISLRSIFEKLSIVALAQNNESMLKVKSAGANKVMPILQIAASIIGDILVKPIVTSVLHDVLYEDSGLSVMEMEVSSSSTLCGTHLYDTHFKRDFDVVLLAIVDHEMGATFSFASHGHNHHIDKGDILVAIGYKEKLDYLKKYVQGDIS